jgi:type I restriction enzyme S subunit
LKYIARVQTGIAKGKDNSGQETMSVPYLRVANVQDGYLALDDVATIDIPVDALERYRLRVGDVLMNEGGDFDKLGRGHIWDGSIDPCIHQNHVFAVRPTKVSAEWINAVTGTTYAQFYFMAHSKQSTNLASISSTNVMNLPVVLPPQDEQDDIQDFLVREIGKIDGLVEEQRRLVELLKEKRRATISQTVTKGLDPKVQMKESGVAWLGKIPAHWDVVPLKWLTQPDRPIMYGIVLPGPDVGVGVPILKGGNVRPSRLRLDALARTTPEIEAPYARARLRRGDLVYSIRGSIGDCELVPDELEGCNITQDVARIAPDSGVDANWLRFALLSEAVAEDLACGSLGAAVRGINIYDLKRAMIPVPPEDERAEIARVVGEAVEGLETLMEAAALATAFLQERRSALISAAVTGKIDVRGLVKARPTGARTRSRQGEANNA